MRGVALALLLLAMVGCGAESGTAPAPSTTTLTTDDDTRASPVAGTTLDGEQVSLDQFRGRPVLVNVWSSW